MTLFLVLSVALVTGSSEALLPPETPSASSVRAGFDRVVNKLDSVHLVYATRGNQVAILDSSVPPVRQIDLRVSGDEMQCRVVQVGTTEERLWWDTREFLGTCQLLTRGNIAELNGLKACQRNSGDFVWAQCRDPSDSVGSRDLYTRGESPSRTPVLYFPLVELNRSWLVPEDGSLAPNLLHQIPVGKWDVLRLDKLDGVDAVVVNITVDEFSWTLKRHPGESLGQSNVWEVWFVEDPVGGFHPMRILKTCKYRFRDKSYRLRREGIESTVVYESYNLKDFGAGLWFPESGKHETAGPPSDAQSLPFDPDSIVDQLLSNGIYFDKEPYAVVTRREWQLGALEVLDDLPPTGLWFEPPLLAHVLEPETSKRFIVGVSDDESERILTRGAEGPIRKPFISRGFTRAIFISIFGMLGLLVLWMLKNRGPSK